MAKLKAKELQNLDIDSALELGTDQIADVGMTIIPAGTYNFALTASIVEKEGSGDNPDFSAIDVEAVPTAVVEFIEGPKGEEPSALSEEDIPEKHVFSYKIPDRLANFNTDWRNVGLQVTGKEKLSMRELMEAINGVEVQGTITYYKKKDDAGNLRVYVNINEAVPLQVGDE